METLKVFLVDDHMVSTPNAGNLTSLSLPTSSNLAEDFHPRHFRELRWASNQSPQLAFIPVSMRWEGPLFSRFSINNMKAIPVESTNDGRFILSEKMRIEWSRSEEGLQFVADNLLGPNGRISLDLAYLPLPSSYGYLRSHKDPKIVRRCAMNSRDSFVCLIAMVSYSISFYNNSFYRERAKIGQEFWIGKLVDRGVHPEWAASLKDSSIADFSGNIPRVGTVIDVRTCNWLKDVEHLIRANVPVWFCWGKNRIQPSTIIAKYFPSKMQAQQALKARDLPDTAPPLPTFPFSTQDLPDDTSGHDFTPPAPTSSRKYPPPEKHSGQKEGEHWTDFFARRENWIKKFEENESPSQKQSRLDREKLAAQGRGYTAKNTRVFQWVDIDGFLIRTSVFRKELEDVWEDYVPEHRKYNSYLREWDLCTEFDKTVDPTPLDDYEHEDDEDHFGFSLEEGQLCEEVRFVGLDQAKQLPMSAWRDDLVNTYGEGNSHSIESAPSQEYGLAGLLYERFGFNWVLSDGGYDAAIDEQTWKTYGTNLIGDNSFIEKEFRAPVVDFLAKLSSGSLDQRLCWDLSASSSPGLRMVANQYYMISKQLYKPASPSKDNHPTASQSAPTSSMESHVLQPVRLNREKDWELTLDSAASVLLCIRTEVSALSDVCELAHLLLQRGVQFHTFTPRNLLEQQYKYGSIILRPIADSNVPPSVELLGLRPYKYKFDAGDYSAYEHARGRLFSTPRARAALLKGGIVWRLAVESISCEVVFAGPSEDALLQGETRILSNGQIVCDDDLTDEEMSLICGVYSVHAENRNTCTHMSWWPKQAIWARSAYNAGYWTRYAEEWFQHRLEKIRNNQADCLSSAEWYKKVPRKGKANLVTRKNEEASAKFLDGYDFP